MPAPPPHEDPLEILFRLRTHFVELLARATPASDAEKAEVAKLDGEVSRIGEQINLLLEQSFEKQLPALKQASAELEQLNSALIDARQGNQSIKQGIQIAARVIQIAIKIAALVV